MYESAPGKDELLHSIFHYSFHSPSAECFDHRTRDTTSLLQHGSFVFYFASFKFCWNIENYGICPFCHMVQSKHTLFGDIIVSTDQLIPMLTHCLVAGLV